MKIAQVAPLIESVPPRLYGGTERVVSYLTEELVGLGHDVTLYASGDSRTSARLQPMCDRALRLSELPRDSLAQHLLMVNRIFNESHLYDFIHFHVDYIHYPLARLSRTPHLTTLHGRQDIYDLQYIYDEFSEMPVISISNSQRKPLPQANWRATVYHGLPKQMLSFHPEPGEYLAFLGRISPEKGVGTAIEIALALGWELRIAAKVDSVNEQFFHQHIKHFLKEPLINFIGEITEEEKDNFLGNASALLFPIDWPEPFGLVMIEAMACGTPVIAFRRGSVPEIIQNGVTGFIVEDAMEAVAAAHKIKTIDRSICRSVFEERFSSRRMAEDYLNVYRNHIISRKNDYPYGNGVLNYGRRYSDRRQMVYTGNLTNS